MRTLFGVLVLLITATPIAWSQPGIGSYAPTARDLEPPIQDLETLEGEIVWLQAVLLRGDPTPYRDPRVPLAAYEQGILDEEGRMWTILDTPKGREIRYNPELRGQRIELAGWLFPESRIVNVHNWADIHSHPVRLDENFPEPEKIPFDPSKANPIETIKPTAPILIEPDLLDNSLWKIQEGTDLGMTVPAAPPEAPLAAEGSGRFQEILQEEGLLPTPTEDSDPTAAEPEMEPFEMNIESPSPFESGSTKAPVPPAPPAPPTGLQSKILNEQGEPLARPEEFDEALQRSLFE